MVKKKESNHKYLWVILEVVFVITIILLGIWGYSYWFFKINFPFFESKPIIINSFVGGGPVNASTTYNVEWLFSYVLRILFVFVGNHVEAVIVLQIMMQILAAFIIYRAMRRIAGRILSCILFAAQVVCSLYFFPYTLLSPCWMLLLSGAIIFYLLTLIFTKIFAGKSRQNTVIEMENMDTVAEEKISELKVTDESNTIIENKPVIKLLDNPLPGPKKHVSKTLDYDLKDTDFVDIPMEYDIEVSEEDDFDL